MIRNHLKLFFTIITILLAGICFVSCSKKTEIKPARVGQPMPDFTLPAYQGGEVSLSGYKGKNILLIFPRGLSGKKRFCAIDNYRYAELMEIENAKKIREKYNVEILYVFPYSRKIVQAWVEKNPQQLEDIEKWKTPPASKKLTEGRKKSIERNRKLFPKTFKLKKGEVPTPFPILIDEAREVSRGLGIFTKEWGGSKADQNISSFFIVDKKGDLRFKHIAKDPFDLPDFDKLIATLESIAAE